jgi:diacylglycerol kinase (ATP)
MEPTPSPANKVLYIVNPISGRGKKDHILRNVRTVMDGSGIPYEIVETTGPGHASELSARAVASGVKTIVAIGGDGTVNETAQGIIGTSASLGIVPTGSGNGLARHLGIPSDPKKAVECILGGKTIRIDTATLDDKLFLSMAGVGYDAHVAKKFAGSGKRGFFTYFRIVSKEYRKYKPRKFKMTIDGKKVNRNAFMVSFANSSQFGNNASIDSNAVIDDGFLDVCIVRKVPMLRLPFVIPLLFTKKFDKTLYIEIIRAKEVTVRRKKGKAVHVDGDPMDWGKEFSIKINPLSLNVIIP